MKIPVFFLPKNVEIESGNDLLGAFDMPERRNQNKIKEYIALGYHFDHSISCSGVHALNNLFQLYIEEGTITPFPAQSCKGIEIDLLNELLASKRYKMVKSIPLSKPIGGLIDWGNHFAALVYLDEEWREVDSWGYVSASKTFEESISDIRSRNGKIYFVVPL